jgi:ribosomal protein RSM22 (predicted rRNA methylase)
LQSAISALLEGRPRAPIAERAARMSETYRAGGSSGTVIASDDDVLAYLVARLPATYATVSAVLNEAADVCDFAPKTLTDIGAGPGTASWAAVGAWPSLERVNMVDSSAVFLDMARKLAAGGATALAKADTTRADVTRLPDLPPSDLVIASYALAELNATALTRVALALWQSCTGLLVFVEPGTPAGYARIVACRTALLSAGAKIVAPCPHALPCPIVAPDWCHFSQRLARSRDHMLVKGANVPFEDEKFSYLVVAREHVAVTPYAARVLAPPKKDKTGIAMKLCADGAISSRKVASRDRAEFKEVRDARWGDRL